MIILIKFISRVFSTLTTFWSIVFLNLSSRYEGQIIKKKLSKTGALRLIGDVLTVGRRTVGSLIRLIEEGGGPLLYWR